MKVCREAKEVKAKIWDSMKVKICKRSSYLYQVVGILKHTKVSGNAIILLIRINKDKVNEL